MIWRGRRKEKLGMTRFRHLIWMLMLASGLILSVSHSYAQQPDVGDQPGLLADLDNPRYFDA